MTILAPSPPPRMASELAPQLAEAIAHPRRPRPFTIDADNNRAGWCGSLDEAHASGRPYAVALADDVLAVDADDHDQAAAVDQLAESLAWPVLRVASGRPGHRHLFAVVPDPEDRARIAKHADTLGVTVRSMPMRPPGAPHRLGLAVELLDDPAAFLADVAEVRQLAVIAEHAGPKSRALPPAWWRTMLAGGRWPAGWRGKDRSASAMVWHLCIAAARDGLTVDAVAELLADPHNAGGHGYRERLDRPGKRHADHWLRHHVWPSATKAAERRPPADATEARARLTEHATAVDAAPWPGVAGATDRAILVALLDRACALGTLTPTLSHRGIAKATGVSRRTVSTATKRLKAAGWLQVADLGRGRTGIDADGTRREHSTATRWRLTIPAARTFPTGGTPPAHTSLDGASSRARSRAWPDVCRWRGIGPNGARALDALAEPLTVAELAETLGLNLGNLRARLLPKLAALGLAESDGTTWRTVDDLDEALEAAAVALGLAGKAAEVDAQHDRERAAYLDHRERTRPDRDAKKAAKLAQRRPAATPPLWTDETLSDAVRPPQAPTGPEPPPPTPPERPLAALSGAGGGDAG